jgi:hypothetical protein
LNKSGAGAVNDPDNLVRKIRDLQEEQRVAWRQLANSSLTTFERREVRNQLRHSHSELRQYLQLMSEGFVSVKPLRKTLLSDLENPTFDCL